MSTLSRMTLRLLRERPLVAMGAAIALTVAIVSSSLFALGFVDGKSTSAAPPPFDLRVLRVLAGPHEYFPSVGIVAGASGLAWSPDGQRLAAFVNGGAQVMVLGPNGGEPRISRRYHSSIFGWRGVLGFLSGRRELLTDPATPEYTDPYTKEAQDTAMSVLDAETGEVLRNIPGGKPGGAWQQNIAERIAISPDQKLVAMANMEFNSSGPYRVRIYATDDWRLVTELPSGGDNSIHGEQALAFSPNGAMLAVGYSVDKQRLSRVDLFDVATWTLIRTIDAFPERPPAPAWAPISHVSFNYDNSLIVVASSSGGPFWKDTNGRLARDGEGTLTPEYPAEPIRVFQVSDGARIASTSGTTGGVWLVDNIAWSRTKNVIAFLDDSLVLNLWQPTTGRRPYAARKLERATTAIAFSPDGKMLGQSFGEGIRLFSLTDNN